MQGGDGLLLDRPGGHRAQCGASQSFEQGFAIGAVGLVAEAVLAHVLGREQGDVVAHRAELASPEVSRSAGLHDDVRRRLLGEELEHARARLLAR